MKKKSPDQPNLIYRLFLLSIMFGVLWVKGYLWWAFGIALLLYLGDTFIIPLLVAAMSMPQERPQGRWTKPPRPAKSAPAATADEVQDSPPPAGSDDFREPMPSRSSPRRK